MKQRNTAQMHGRSRLLLGQWAAILAVAALFAAFNFSMYQVLTRRLAGNFDGTSQARMIDLESYLPHQEETKLPEAHASLTLTGDLPVLDGATALVPVYAAVIHNLYPEGCVTFEGGTFSDDNSTGENFAADSVMQYKNTVRGYKAVVDGETDVFFGAGPSKEQEAYAKEQGVTLVYVPIGLEAFVFFVNEKNPVDGLTSDQIRKIYAGEYTNWSDVGGANRTINPVSRLAGSGSQTSFLKFMGDTPVGRKSLFALTGGAIGFSFRYYMEGIVENEAVKIISLDGVYPSADHIRDRSYPLVSSFYAIYREDNSNENIPVLISWLLSEEGQRLIEETGYVRGVG